MKDLTDAAVLLKECIKHEQVVEINIPHNSKCYYSDHILHMHREVWSEENLIVFYRSVDLIGEMDIISTDNPHRRVYFYSVSLDADLDFEFRNVLSAFMRIDPENYSVVLSNTVYSIFNYSEVVRVGNLLSFS